MTATDDRRRIGGERYIRISEAAELLGIGTRRAYRWAERGRLPTVDLGGPRGRFVPVRVLEAMLAAHERSALESLAEPKGQGRG